MLSASVSSTLSALIVLMVVIGASSIMVNDVVTKPPLVFSKWPPTAYQNNKSPQSLRQQIFVQLRSTGRIPPQNMMLKRYPPPQSMSYMMRPMKYAQLKKTPIISAPSYYRPTISTPPRYRFQSSQQAPNTGEYVFENPFSNFGFGQNKKKISLTDESKYNPIHTVPAPNLVNKNLAYSTQAEYIHDPMDNHIYEPKDPQFNQITFRPLTIPQYQVTEQINDHTVRVDPYTGKPKFYGSDPVQSIPSYKLSQTFDSFNQPNSIGSRPLPFEISFVPANQPQVQENSAPVASPLIQLANQEPQQQLPDTYALPIGNQPQLQQHLLQQQSMLHNVPVVYNPTYLVTQSNNLLKQHREQLFKPAPAFLGTINQATVDLSPNNVQPLQDVNSVASPGQILNSAQSQQKNSHQVHQTQSQSLNQHSHTQSLLNSLPLRNEFQSVEPQTQNAPTFQRYVADRPGPTNNNIIVQEPILTESELNSLLNIENSVHDAPNRFITSTYYQAQPDPQIEIENRQRQHYNDITIAKANEEQKEKVISVPETTVKPNSRKKTAHQEHQEKLAEQFPSKTSLRIIVPDEEEYQKKNEVRRSDVSRFEPKLDYAFKPSKPIYGRYDPYVNHVEQNYSRHDQYSNDEEQNHGRGPHYVNDDDDDDDENELQTSTTETNVDYLAHDIT